jgi:hypothetical protein
MQSILINQTVKPLGVYWEIDEYNSITQQHERVYYKIEITGMLWRKTKASYAIDRLWSRVSMRETTVPN